ncbi:MAG: PEPxxWA-CTERM sorting domain-containing protein [Sandarakinorhabdus sp.]|nr:PEPxxWA-CTERM sorting domain-containing protein [Sandarakinorhabdus sp.]
MNIKSILLGFAISASLGSAAQAANLVVNGSFNNVTIANAGSQDRFGSDGYVNLADDSGYLDGWIVKNHADITAQAWYYPTGAADTNPAGGDWYDGWAIHGPANGSDNGFGLSPDGGALVSIDGGGDYRASLDQTLTGLTSGKTYEVKFYWAGAQQSCCGGTTTEQVQVGFGNSTQSTAVWNNPENGFSGWFSERFRFVADNSSQTLSFLAIGTPYGQPPVVLLDGVSVAGVPEPSSWVMLIAGFGLVGATARRRRLSAVAA